MLKIVYNEPQNLSLEEFMNEEYEAYVLESDDKLDKGAIELKRAWLLIIDRLKTYGVLKQTRTHKEVLDRIKHWETEKEASKKAGDYNDVGTLDCMLDELYWMINENREE